MTLIILTIAAMIFFNALYVAAEFATVSARRTRIAEMADAGNRWARLLLPMTNSSKALDNYVAACQVGITISSLVLGAYGQNTVAALLVPFLVDLGNLAEPVAFSISVTVVLLFLTTLQVMLGELFPKSVAIEYPEKLALLTVVPMKWSLVLFRPFNWLLNGSGNLVLRLFRVDYSEHRHLHSPEEIELLVSESHEGGLVQDQEQQWLRNTFRLRELVARQVMVPRTRVVAASAESSVDALINVACRAGFSRIPLYRSGIDDIEGFVHIKDLFRLRLQGRQNPKPVIREIIYVPETLSIAGVWTTLNQKRQYIALVVDEYGGTAGLVTFEDLIEEIFGELQDEFDDELKLISSDKEGHIHLRADLLVTDVNEYLKLTLPEDEADTLGGLVFSQLGHIPHVGDEVTIGEDSTTIRVESVDGRSVTEVALLLPAKELPYIQEWEVTDNR